MHTGSVGRTNLLIEGLVLSSSSNSFRCQVPRSALLPLHPSRVGKPGDAIVCQLNVDYMWEWGGGGPINEATCITHYTCTSHISHTTYITHHIHHTTYITHHTHHHLFHLDHIIMSIHLHTVPNLRLTCCRLIRGTYSNLLAPRTTQGYCQT